MKKNNFLLIKLIKICIMLLVWTNSTVVFAQMEKVISSYGPTNQTETFDQIKASRMAVKSERSKLQKELLNSRYNLSTKTATEAVMSGGKPLPIGPTAKLKGTSWNELDKMTPKQIKEKGLFPYKPLPFADHAEGGMLFPEMISKLLPRLVPL